MATLMTAKEYIALIEKELKDILGGCDASIGEAMRYAVLDGGKRVRPLCVYLGAKAVAGDIDSACVNDLLILGEAIELIHSYSLVHDDMPEMDNDDYRRGKLSVHKKYGVGTALLVGDGLLSLAMKLLVKCSNHAASEQIANAALNMVYGQAAECNGCNSREEYLAMYAKKTGALIKGAFLAGAICALDKHDDGVYNEDGYKSVKAFAEHLGVAFQLADDLLDDGNSIADLIGRDETKRLLDEHSAAAVAAAEKLKSSDELITFAQVLWHRKT
ncbi:MAG: polyprenyl synthetase family protein [Clostridiales bacterium]|nr:polyprenyl synthetase family protein [Clostridiales bacterium]